MTSSSVFSLQWSYFKVKGKVLNYQSLLNSIPSNIFQLNFWAQVMMVYRIQGYDIPESAVFYLNDQSYLNLLQKVSLRDRINCKFKLKIVAFIFKIDSNQSLLRNLSQVITASTALIQFNSPQFDTRKINAIVKYLQSQCDFIHPITVKKIAYYLSNQSLVSKQIKQINDSIIGAFTVQQMAINFQNLDKLKEYLLCYKKNMVFYPLKEYFIKNKNPYAIQLLIEMAQKFGLMNELLISFQNNPSLFYNLYSKIVKSKSQLQFINFSNFMLKHSCIQPVLLFKTILPFTDSNNLLTMRQLLERKDYGIFKRISKKSSQGCLQCMRYYLNQSKFKIPNRITKVTKNTKQDMSLYDPLCTIGIIRKIWQDPFHSRVLSFCIWLMLRNWLIKMQSFKPEQQQLNNYHKHMFSILVQLCMSYKANIFVNYYPIQNNLIPDLFSMQSLPTLILSNSSSLDYLWVYFIGLKQFKNLIKFQNGYQLFWRILTNKNFNDVAFPQVLGWIQHDLIMQKNSKLWQSNLQVIQKILNYYGGIKNLMEPTERLKRAIQKQQNWYRNSN